jgi:small-conductance mechanosensitive channel
MPLAYLGVIYFGLQTLNISEDLKPGFKFFFMGCLTILVARGLTSFAAYGFSAYWAHRGKDLAVEHSLKGMLNIINFLIWFLAVIFFCDNMGFKISTLIAGLGIGGVAVALAAQAILGDLFSYFSILFDRPFEVGDFIIVGDLMGSVQHIGIKTTRIMSLSGEQIVFSNTDLTNSRVRNFRRMEKRRILFKVGVTYDTPVEKLQLIPGLIKDAITAEEKTTFDRANFASYGDFSLNFEVVYYINSPDYNFYMNIQEKINLRIMEDFTKHGIEFAYLTQTLYVRKEGGEPASGS